MALIKCPECGKEISEHALSCPNCGYPVSLIENKSSEKKSDFESKTTDVLKEVQSNENDNLVNADSDRSNDDENKRISNEDITPKGDSDKEKKKNTFIKTPFILGAAVIALLLLVLIPGESEYESYDDSAIDSDYDSGYDSNYNTENTFVAPADELIVDADGKQIYKVYCTTGSLHFTGSFSGQGNFIVEVLNNNQDLQELVVNEIGDYVVDKTVYVGTGYHYIQIECSRGTWTMKWEGTGTTYQ